MTTITGEIARATPHLPSRPFPARVASVVRLILIDRWSFLYVPIIIVSSAFVMTIAVWLIVLHASNGQAADNPYPGAYLGGVQAVFWYMLAMAIQTVNRAFPLAMGLSVSRREFHAGFSVILLIIPLAIAALYTVLAVIEEATGGWGIGMMFFTTLGVRPWYVTFLVYFAIVFFLMTVPSIFAAAYMRWKNTGVLISFAILTVALVGSIALITLNDWWPAVLTWIVAQGEVGMAAWSILLSLFAIGGLYLMLRRATP